jgi:hypothetical protein
MKSYEVLSDQPVLGHAKGETFEADLSEAQERRMIERGSIRLAGGSSPTATPAAATTGDSAAKSTEGTGKGSPLMGLPNKEGGN